jgi:hypothetical protein
MESIIVSSNCTTGPIADHLRCLYPKANINTVPVSEIDYIEKIIDLSASGDHVIFHLASDLSILREKGIFKKRNQSIQIPFFGFYGFHPDLVYCQKKDDSTLLTSPHYNSRIVLFAYENNLSPIQTKNLFSENIFRMLGYFDAFKLERQELKRLFLNANINSRDFDRFFNTIQRLGIFMHSGNHPNILTIRYLTKLLIENHDPFINFEDYNFNLVDGLISPFVFPVYPEIASNLALRGNYSWSFLNGNVKYQFNNLLDYIIFSFDNYQKIGFESNNLNYWITENQRNILSNEVNKL